MRISQLEIQQSYPKIYKSLKHIKIFITLNLHRLIINHIAIVITVAVAIGIGIGTGIGHDLNFGDNFGDNASPAVRAGFDFHLEFFVFELRINKMNCAQCHVSPLSSKVQRPPHTQSVFLLLLYASSQPTSA